MPKCDVIPIVSGVSLSRRSYLCPSRARALRLGSCLHPQRLLRKVFSCIYVVRWCRGAGSHGGLVPPPELSVARVLNSLVHRLGFATPTSTCCSGFKREIKQKVTAMYLRSILVKGDPLHGKTVDRGSFDFGRQSTRVEIPEY